eukprot:3834625-Rhodomonas_salina.1
MKRHYAVYVESDLPVPFIRPHRARGCRTRVTVWSVSGTALLRARDRDQDLFPAVCKLFTAVYSNCSQ